MIAVTGAIVSSHSIAITAFSLARSGRHILNGWPARLLCSAWSLFSLPVYYACVLQQQSNSLHSPHETWRWLTTVKTEYRKLEDDEAVSSTSSGKYDRSILFPSTQPLLLVVPSVLLTGSSIALLIGHWNLLQYGIVHGEHLCQIRGSDTSNLFVLLVQVGFNSDGYLHHTSALPWWWKSLESANPVQSVLRELFHDYSKITRSNDTRREWKPGPFSPKTTIAFDAERTLNIL
ncbi:hypothetical protein Q7P37_006730 [Cladosporium fusiforme]